MKPNYSYGPTYISWRRMRQRLGHREAYRHLDMDPRWNDFKVFLADMGERPPGKCLDRLDNNQGYWPWNCRWTTMKEQNNNRKPRPARSNTGVQGICFRPEKGLYCVEIAVAGKQVYLGSRRSLEAAIDLKNGVLPLTRTEERIHVE